MKILSSFITVLLVLAVPSTAQRRRIGNQRGGNRQGAQTGNTQTGNTQTAQTGGRTTQNGVTPGVNAAFDGTRVGNSQIGTATDGSTILDNTVLIKYVSLTFRPICLTNPGLTSPF